MQHQQPINSFIYKPTTKQPEYMNDEVLRRTSSETAPRHGPASKCGPRGNNVDQVFCVRVLTWPPSAFEWKTRLRLQGWPTQAAIDHVVRGGCVVVQVGHSACTNDEWLSRHQFRLSFSRAETFLLNTWTPRQQIVYHVLRVIAKFGATPLNEVRDEADRKPLSTYHFKTLALWMCEETNRHWWDQHSVIRICHHVLLRLHECLTENRCPGYFIKNVNLFERKIPEALISLVEQLLDFDNLCTWLKHNYMRNCTVIVETYYPGVLKDITTVNELSKTIVEWRQSTALSDSFDTLVTASKYVVVALMGRRPFSLTPEKVESFVERVEAIDRRLKPLAVAFMFCQLMTHFNGGGGRLLTDRAICSMSTLLKLSVETSTPPSVQIVDMLAMFLKYQVTLMQLRVESTDEERKCRLQIELAKLYKLSGNFQHAIEAARAVSLSPVSGSQVVEARTTVHKDNICATVAGLFELYSSLHHHKTLPATEDPGQPQRQRLQMRLHSVFNLKLLSRYVYYTASWWSLQNTARDLPRFVDKLRTEWFRETEQVRCNVTDFLLCRLTIDNLLQQLHTAVSGPCNSGEQRQQYGEQPTLVELPTVGNVWKLVATHSAVQLGVFHGEVSRDFRSLGPMIAAKDIQAMFFYKKEEYERCLKLSQDNLKLLMSSSTGAESRRSWIVQGWYSCLLDIDCLISVSTVFFMATGATEIGIYRGSPLVFTQFALSLFLIVYSKMKLHYPVESLIADLRLVRTCYDREQFPSNYLLVYLYRRTVRYLRQKET